MRTLSVSFLVVVMMLSFGVSTAQISLPPSVKMDKDWVPPDFDKDILRDLQLPPTDDLAWFQCPENSQFSQPFFPYEEGFLTVLSLIGPELQFFSLAFDEFQGLHAPITGITFWGLALTETPDPEPITLDMAVLFLDIDDLEEVHMFEVRATGYPYPYIVGDEFIPLYRFEMHLPEAVTMSEGMMSIVQVVTDDEPEGLFFWMFTDYFEPDAFSLVLGIVIGPDGEELIEGPFPANLSFCFHSYYKIPFKPWALGITIFLILTFTVFRYRRYFS